MIMNEEEKQGGVEFTQQEAMDFTQCVNNCALTELKFSDRKFTWWNEKIEEECIFKRLDRVLGNQEFFNILPSSEVIHQVRQVSDHAPLHVVCNSEEEPAMRPFRFLNFWTRHSDFRKTIKECWTIDFVGCHFYEFQAKMRKTKGCLARWSKEKFGNFFKTIATLEEELKVKEL